MLHADTDTGTPGRAVSKKDAGAGPSPRVSGPAQLWKKLYNRFIGPLMHSKHPPWFDARGVALGVVIGLGTPVGAHTAAICLLRLAVRFNFVAALAFTWVCNPFNIIFLYYGYYYFGSYVLGRPANMDFHMFERLILPIAEKGHFWEALSEFMKLGEDLLARWFVAAVIIALVSGLIAYAITYFFQTQRCKSAATKLGIRYEKLVEELEEGTTGGRS